MTLQLNYQMCRWWMDVKACQPCNTYFNSQSIQTKYISFGCSPSQQQSSPEILQCLVIVDPLLNHWLSTLTGLGEHPNIYQTCCILFLQVRNGVRRRKRRRDFRHFGAAGNVGGTGRFESCSVMLAESWVLKSRHWQNKSRHLDWNCSEATSLVAKILNYDPPLIL